MDTQYKDALEGLPRRIECLDSGFVELVDVSPRLVKNTPEEAIVRAARVSYANDSAVKTPQEDANLIRYLVENRHTSPLEMVDFSLKMCLPLAIATQILRHRTASVNAMSHRYTSADSAVEEGVQPWYKPVSKKEDIRYQSTLNRQTSEKGSSEHEAEILHLFQEMDSLTGKIYEKYQRLLDLGCAREMARFYLPVGTYTVLYWKMDLHNLLNFLSLRLASDAQEEIRVYADAIYQLIKPLVPNVIQAFEASRLHSVVLTQPEVEAVCQSMGGSVASRDSLKLGSKRKDAVLHAKVEKLGFTLE